MSLRSPIHDLRSIHPLAAELAVVVAVLVGVHLWRRFVTALQPTLSAAVPVDGLLADGLLTGAVLVGGLTVYAVGYATLRGIEVGTVLPSTRDARVLGTALALPPALVALTKLVGTATGVPYNALTMSAYAAGTSPWVISAVLLPGLLVGACSLTLVCQVVVQGTFERTADGRTVTALTIGFTAVVLTGSTGGLSPVPAPGKLALSTAFVVSLAVALYAVDAVARDSVRYLAYLPVSAVVGLVVLSWIASVGSAAELLFGATHVAVLGVAAIGYERTDSVLVPAVAYFSLLLSQEAVVVLFEAGIRSW